MNVLGATWRASATLGDVVGWAPLSGPAKLGTVAYGPYQYVRTRMQCDLQGHNGILRRTLRSDT